MQASDNELLERWRGGDRAAGQELFERYYHLVERFFANKLASDALDLVQETFVACLEGRDRVSEGGKFRSYLFAVACNVLRGHLRRRYRDGEQLDFEEVSVNELAPGAGTLLGRLREQRLL
ncbi:MAG TPA: sigma-70 family RNA polymerase sigma factor, partial [Haliangium sp.]|nr:sigma-70 family RNA polymerase sigma factor [Haliangium sp.]